MNIQSFFSVPTHSRRVDIALLVLRLVSGAAFVIHGWGKIQNPFGWMGPDAFAPGPLQALAALAEFGGGLAWVLGLLTPLASLGIAATMIVAVWMHAVVGGDPFVSMTGGASYELATVFFAIALVLATTGPGTFSLDRKLFGRR